MESEPWREVQALFHAVLAQPDEERQAFLDHHCSHPDVRREVNALLAGYADADALAGAAVHDAVRQLTCPERIGPYRVLREIGRGGLGEVYLAERDDNQYSLQVAIKLVRRGLDSEVFHERFRLERQILAQLAHPHVARFLDGGSTAEGRPYFVMEHIDGVPIDTYCAQQQLTVRQRLVLFRQVAAAVHYAHQNLVVHRDLKPSNVLVTAEGVPKLLDFGIAKLLDPGRYPSAMAPTATGSRLFTPEFASPEQVRGEALTTASDVYALGVMLYLLLTGQHPYRLDNRDDPLELERTICAAEPERPSTAVGRAAAMPPLPGLSRARLRRRLSGDLDNIVLMALRKDPQRRYASVEQLAQDLDRHLRGLPVVARPDTVVYRTVKFMRRNGAAVAALAAFLLLTVGLVSFYTARLAVTRDRAQHAADRAEEVRRFLVRLFDAFDPHLTSSDISAREILYAGVARIDGELAEQPAVQAELKDLVGTLLQNLGRFEEAQVLLEEGLALRQAYSDGDRPEVAASLGHLGDLQIDLGRWVEAKGLYLQALAMRRRLWGDRHPEVAASLHDLGVVDYYQQQYGIAARRLGEALALRRALLGDDHPDVAATLSSLAAVHYQLTDYEPAREALETALAIRQRAYGTRHLEVASTLSNLAAIPGVEDAEAKVRKALAIHRELLGEAHLQVAIDLQKLATLLKNRQAYGEAEGALVQALALTRQLGGEDHPNLPLLLGHLGDVQSAAGRPGEAEQSYRQSLGVRRSILPTTDWRLSSSLLRLGTFLVDHGDGEEAVALLREAVQIRTAARPDDWRTAYAVGLLGEALWKAGAIAEAGELLEHAAARLERQRPDSSYTAAIRRVRNDFRVAVDQR